MARILVVEDEPDIALGLQLDLRDEGHEVEMAEPLPIGPFEAALGVVARLLQGTPEPPDVAVHPVLLRQVHGGEVEEAAKKEK